MENQIIKPEYEFTNDWFGITAKAGWDNLFKGFPYKKILEIGSFEGRSLCYMIEKFGADPFTDHELEIHAVDTWLGGHDHGGVDMAAVEERFKNNVAKAIHDLPDNKKVNLKIHKAHSHLVLAALLADGQSDLDPDRAFDFIYIDGSHIARDVLTDAVLAFRLLKEGGVMIFDDYTWRESGNPLFSPKAGIDAFINIHFDKINMVNLPISQMGVQKKCDY